MPLRNLCKDEGEILLLGKPVDFKTSKEALENGISMVHQELNLGASNQCNG